MINPDNLKEKYIREYNNYNSYKVCNKCNDRKPLILFYEKFNWCKSCHKDINKQYYIKNRANILNHKSDTIKRRYKDDDVFRETHKKRTLDNYYNNKGMDPPKTIRHKSQNNVFTKKELAIRRNERRRLLYKTNSEYRNKTLECSRVAYRKNHPTKPCLKIN
jgi:hypothetical protein